MESIIYGENYIHGQIEIVLVVLDIMYQVMGNLKHLKQLLMDELIVEMLQTDGYVMDYDGVDMIQKQLQIIWFKHYNSL